MAEYIYQMVRARKAVGDKVILDDLQKALNAFVRAGNNELRGARIYEKKEVQFR